MLILKVLIFYLEMKSERERKKNYFLSTLDLHIWYRRMSNINQTDNAGLELTADVLEEIYVNKDFPKLAETLPVSLADSGKSRADLWSFAAVVGVEWGLERNNAACEGEDWIGNTVS